MLRQYTYISTAPDLPDDAVETIVSQCKHNNVLVGVTGFLLYNGRNFFQLLEGEEAALRRVLARIAQDSRHSGINRMADRLITSRDCPDWEMRRIRIVDDVEERRASLKKQLPVTLDDGMVRTVMGFAGLN